MIDYGIADGVATLTIDRPDKANSLPVSGKAELAEKVRTAGSDPEVRALIVSGRGAKSFCAGSDVREMSSFGVDQMHSMLGEEHAMYLALLEVPKPVVGAVNGHALGAGLILVMCCDYVVAAESAQFGAPEVTIGVSAPLEGLLLPWFVGFGRSRDLLYTGRTLDAGEALDIGIIQERAASQEALLRRAAYMARELAELPGSGFAVQKQLLLKLVMSGNLAAVSEVSQYITSQQFSDPATSSALESRFGPEESM